MIAFSCVGCGKAFQVDDDLAGRKSRCKQCGALMRIPAPEPVEAPLPRLAPAPEAAPAPRRRRKKARKLATLDRDAWVSLGIGAGLAAVALAVPLFGFFLHILVTVIHELGHTATAWILASPALPSFDLNYGGGLSYIVDRQPFLVAVAYGIFALLLFRSRDDRAELVTWGVAAAVYTVVMFTPLRALAITAMGHGAELVVAGIFLHRAFSGDQVLRSEERPLYACIGLFIVLSDALMAVNLMSSQEHREAYGEAKGGGHWMDFDRIASESLHWSLQGVAGLFLLACVLTPVAAFLAHRYGSGRR